VVVSKVVGPAGEFMVGVLFFFLVFLGIAKACRLVDLCRIDIG
jgi:hypothetical protein